MDWYKRLTDYLSRALGIVAQPESVDHGPLWSAEHAASNPYPAVASMSALGKFPWVVAAANAIAEDISGLPLKVMRGSGTRSREVPGHAALNLLRRPTSWQGRTSWERQWIIDWLLSGDGYQLMVGGARPSSLLRLHPASTSIVPSESGAPRAYRFAPSGVETFYGADDVLHLRSPSWQDGPEGLYGQGAIEVLGTELGGEWAAARQWQKSAQRGRADVIISPKDAAAGAVWAKPEQRAKIKQAFERHSNEGGIVVLSGEADVHQVPFSARDMEFMQARGWTRDAVLAVFGVVGTRVGLPDANYATAQQQTATYWQALLGKIAILDEQLSRVAERLGRTGDRIVHDTSGVEALQESRSARLDRVVVMVEKLKIPAADALNAEGFADLADVAAASVRASDAQTTADAAPPPSEQAAQQRHLRLVKGDDTMRRDLGLTLRLLPSDGTAEVGKAVASSRFIASTGQVDRMGDIIKQDGWDLASWRRNPVILWQHDNGRAPIGRGVDAAIVDGNLEITVEWDMADPFAAEIAGKVERGFIQAGSVGLIPRRLKYRSDLPMTDPDYAKDSWGVVIYEAELVEFSIVTVPANGGALLAASAASDRDLTRLLADPDNRRRLRALLAAEGGPTQQAEEPDPLAAFFKEK